MNEIPLGKQLKYTLQEGSLKEDVKKWFNLTVEQQERLSEDIKLTREVLALEQTR